MISIFLLFSLTVSVSSLDSAYSSSLSFFTFRVTIVSFPVSGINVMPAFPFAVPSGLPVVVRSLCVVPCASMFAYASSPSASAYTKLLVADHPVDACIISALISIGVPYVASSVMASSLVPVSNAFTASLHVICWLLK